MPLHSKQSILLSPAWLSITRGRAPRDKAGDACEHEKRDPMQLLRALCVDQNQQRQGIGSQLVDKLKTEAKNDNFRKLLLLTHEENKPTMILAIKKDFIPEGSLKNHFRDGKKDVIYLSCFL